MINSIGNLPSDFKKFSVGYQKREHRKTEVYDSIKNKMVETIKIKELKSKIKIEIDQIKNHIRSQIDKKIKNNN